MWDIISCYVISNHKTQAYVFINVYEVLFKLFVTQFMWFPYVCFLSLDSCIIASESYVLWFGCIILFKVFLLCVICGLTMMIIGIDIRVHNK